MNEHSDKHTDDDLDRAIRALIERAGSDAPTGDHRIDPVGVAEHPVRSRWLVPAAAALLALGVASVVTFRHSGSKTVDPSVLPSVAAYTTTVNSAAPAVREPDAVTQASTTPATDAVTTQTAAGNATAPLAAPLDLGSSGPDVVHLQERLAELSFTPGPADGIYTTQTEHAVWAFKTLVLQIPLDQLTALVTNDVWETMQQSHDIIPRRTFGANTTHIEIYLPQQVLAVFTGDHPTLIAHISSGTGQQYCETINVDTDQNGDPLGTPTQESVCALATTPPGVFRISHSVAGDRTTPIGNMRNPVYFNYGIAIAGNNNVPAAPASHGGVRVDQTIATLLPGLVHTGDAVYVWGDDGRQPENHTKAESLPSFQHLDTTTTTTT